MNGTSAHPEIIITERDRYTRLRAIDWWDQARLRSSRLMVAGAGALGNEVLKNLALIGVGHILVVDFDHVDVTNLSRSVLFRPGDEGRPKAEVAAQRLREINPDVDVRWLHGDVVWDVGLALLRGYHVVIGCLDSREARLGLNRNCWRVGVPWIDGALGVMSGQVRTYVPPDTACYECSMTQDDYRELNTRVSCQLLAAQGILVGQVSTTPVSASVTAAIQVQEAIKWLHGLYLLAGYEIEYDGQRHLYRTTRLSRREDCLSHDPLPLDQITVLPEARAAEITGEQLVRRVRSDLGENAYVLMDREVITSLTCPYGHGRDRRIRPRHMTSAQDALCPICGAERLPEYTHRIDNGVVASMRLADLGIPPGHILMAQYGSAKRYYALGGDL